MGKGRRSTAVDSTASEVAVVEVVAGKQVGGRGRGRARAKKQKSLDELVGFKEFQLGTSSILEVAEYGKLHNPLLPPSTEGEGLGGDLGAGEDDDDDDRGGIEGRAMLGLLGRTRREGEEGRSQVVSVLYTPVTLGGSPMMVGGTGCVAGASAHQLLDSLPVRAAAGAIEDSAHHVFDISLMRQSVAGVEGGTTVMDGRVRRRAFGGGRLGLPKGKVGVTLATLLATVMEPTKAILPLREGLFHARPCRE